MRARFPKKVSSLLKLMKKFASCCRFSRTWSRCLASESVHLIASPSLKSPAFEMSESVLAENFSADPKIRNLRKRKRLDDLLHKITNAR